MRSTGIVLLVAALCGSIAGCVSDAGTPLSSGVASSSGDGTSLRYYGGPKSPMWPDR